MKVLFVCTGNTCRSPMAEGLFRQMVELEGLDIDVLSAGTMAGNGIFPSENSVLAMEELDIDIRNHRARQITQELLDNADLVLTMGESHKGYILHNYSIGNNKIFSLLEFGEGRRADIVDPYGGSSSIYEKTRDEIERVLKKVLDRIKELNEKRVIGIGSDHGGYELKEEIKLLLEELGIEYRDFGTNSKESVDYPEYGKKVAQGVVGGDVDLGIVICGTGIGISLAANKVSGIRCALCENTYSAKMSRRHNNANMLALGGRVLGVDLAKEIVKTWLSESFEGGRHERRVNMIE